jgi:hypothetical protein
LRHRSWSRLNCKVTVLYHENWNKSQCKCVTLHFWLFYYFLTRFSSPRGWSTDCSCNWVMALIIW